MTLSEATNPMEMEIKPKVDGKTVSEETKHDISRSDKQSVTFYDVEESKYSQFGLKRDWLLFGEAPRREKKIYCKSCIKGYT